MVFKNGVCSEVLVLGEEVGEEVTVAVPGPFTELANDRFRIIQLGSEFWIEVTDDVGKVALSFVYIDGLMELVIEGSGYVGVAGDEFRCWRVDVDDG